MQFKLRQHPYDQYRSQPQLARHKLGSITVASLSQQGSISDRSCLYLKRTFRYLWYLQLKVLIKSRYRWCNIEWLHLQVAQLPLAASIVPTAHILHLQQNPALKIEMFLQRRNCCIWWWFVVYFTFIWGPISDYLQVQIENSVENGSQQR